MFISGNSLLKRRTTIITLKKAQKRREAQDTIIITITTNSIGDSESARQTKRGTITNIAAC